MSIRKLIARVLISTLFGGLFYSIWLAVYLLSSPNGGLFETALWLTAPIVTAAGFASGLTVVNHFSMNKSIPFTRTLSWPLAGCIIGALAVYWFGPMLIVFSMLALGTIAVAVREVITAS